MTDIPKLGRPTIYTDELAYELCVYLASGESMRTACAHEGMPAMATVFRWLREKESFREQYARAKQEAADAMAEEILDIADDGTNDYMTIYKGDQEYNVEDREVTNRSRLRVDTRKWLMAKMKPKKYGEKVDITTGGKPLPLLGGITRDTDNDGDPQTGGAQETD